MKQKIKLSNKLLVINTLVIVLFGILFLLLLQFLRTKSEWIIVTFKVTDDNPLYATRYPNYEFAKSFKTGDIEFNELGIKQAEIIKVDSYRNSPDNFVVYVDVKLKASYDKRMRVYKYKGKPLVFGETQTFIFPSVRFEGLVAFTSKSGENLNNKKFVRIQSQINYSRLFFSETDGVPPYIADQIEEGQIMTDSANNIIARIVKVEKNPADRMLPTNDGRLVVVKDPELIDVLLTIDLSVFELDGRLYYFDYKPLSIGTVIPIDLKNVYIWPTVTKIEEIN